MGCSAAPRQDGWSSVSPDTQGPKRRTRRSKRPPAPRKDRSRDSGRSAGNAQCHGSTNRLVDRTPGPFSVAETFESVRSMIQPIAEEKGVAIRLVHPVPERRVGQARALSRVLLNLATNAVKFTDSGFVEVSARPLDGRRLEFSVRDTGAGIDPALLRSLYQPVRLVATAGGVGLGAGTGGRHHFSSSGMGLAICRKLVTAMGAELEVETRSNWGTRF